PRDTDERLHYVRGPGPPELPKWVDEDPGPGEEVERRDEAERQSDQEEQGPRDRLGARLLGLCDPRPRPTADAPGAGCRHEVPAHEGWSAIKPAARVSGRRTNSPFGVVRSSARRFRLRLATRQGAGSLGLLAIFEEAFELDLFDERPEPPERLSHDGARLGGRHDELGYRSPSKDRIALAMLQTSITRSSRIRSKYRSLETRTARSRRQVAAWRGCAGSGVVTCSAQTVTKFRSTCTTRARLSRAPTSQAAGSDRTSSA